MSRARGGNSAFAPAVVVTLALLGFIGFLAFVGMGAYEQDFARADGRDHALSKSAVGFAGAVDLLNSTGRPTVVARGEVTAEGEPGVMILTLPEDGDPTTALLDLATTRQFEGEILAVLPKWRTVPSDVRSGWVRRLGLDRVDADTWIGPSGDDRRIRLVRSNGRYRHTLRFAEAERDGYDIPTGPIQNLQVLSAAPGWTALVVDERGHMVLGYSDNLYVLSDPDLLNNHGIADLVTARAGLKLIEEVNPDGPVYFDVTLAGLERSRSVLRLMLDPPFLPATLCVVAAALLMFWHAAFGFGAPAAAQGRAFALGKQALADNQAGLIRMARREHRMAGRYASLVAGLVARVVGVPRDLPAGELEPLLDRIGEGRTTHRLSDLRRQADSAADRSQLMTAAERLHQWKLEMTRESK